MREFDKPGAPLVQMAWDHLDTLVKREFNAREYMKGIKAKISPPCELPVKMIDGTTDRDCSVTRGLRASRLRSRCFVTRAGSSAT